MGSAPRLSWVRWTTIATCGAACLLGAPAAAEPITGAFGIRFGETEAELEKRGFSPLRWPAYWYQKREGFFSLIEAETQRGAVTGINAIRFYRTGGEFDSFMECARDARGVSAAFRERHPDFKAFPVPVGDLDSMRTLTVLSADGVHHPRERHVAVSCSEADSPDAVKLTVSYRQSSAEAQASNEETKAERDEAARQQALKKGMRPDEF